MGGGSGFKVERSGGSKGKHFNPVKKANGSRLTVKGNVAAPMLICGFFV
jgi:hypothetical protein